MNVSNHYRGWRASAQEVSRIIELFGGADPSAGSAGMLVLNVRTTTGASWDFDTVRDFLDQLATDDFDRYQLTTSSLGPAELSVSFLLDDLSVSVSLPSRQQMQDFIDAVDRLAPSGF